MFFYQRWFVCLSLCVSMTMITKKIVEGFVPHFTGKVSSGKGKTKFVFRYDR